MLYETKKPVYEVKAVNGQFRYFCDGKELVKSDVVSREQLAAGFPNKRGYVFTKHIIESNAYEYYIEASSREEAIELAKKPENCPVYFRERGCEFDVRAAEGNGNQILEWRDGGKIHRFNLDE